MGLMLEGGKEGRAKGRESGKEKEKEEGNKTQMSEWTFNFNVACTHVCVMCVLDHKVRYISYCDYHRNNLKARALKVITLCAADHSAI